MTHIFKSPKFYKELRMQYRTQAISNDTGIPTVKPRAPGSKLQASSVKSQASSSIEPQASGSKLQAPSTLEQASSRKHQAP